MRIAAVAVLLFALQARADETSEAARSAFQRGQTEYNLGNYSEAAKYFEEVYRLKPVPALLFNIAQCYRFTGNLEKAKQTYRAYLRNAPENDRNQKLAKELLDQVEAALVSKSKAEASPPHGLAGAPPMTGAPVATERPRAQPVVAAATPTPAAPAVKTAPIAAVSSTPAPAAPPSRILPIVSGGAAVVALGAGALFGMKSKSTLSDLQTGFHTRAEIDSQSEAAKSDASKASVMLIAGAALAVASAAFFALDF